MIYEKKGGWIKSWLRSIFFECLEEIESNKATLNIRSNRAPSKHDLLSSTGAQWTDVIGNKTYILTKIEARWEELRDNDTGQRTD